MDTKIARDMKLLKIYVLLSTAAWVVLTLSAFAPHKQRFEEIDVERINVVEKNGQIKLVISNRDRIPDPGNVVTGKYQKRSGIKSPGILFYNESGNECGGLIYTGREEPDGKFLSGALFTFDKYRGDQVLGLKAEEGGGRRIAGLHIWDQPGGAQRVFLGRGLNQSASLALADAKGKTRIRLVVAEDGAAKLDFLDADGKVIQTLPQP